MSIRADHPASAAASTGGGSLQTSSTAGPPGVGQSGLNGFGGEARPVMRVSAVQDAPRQLNIDTPVSAPRKELTVRARPRTAINPPALYPEAARAQGLQGTTYLRVAVTVEGRAENVELLLTSGSDLLDEAAMKAVRGWSFEPARNDAGPFRSVISVPVRFTAE